MKLPIYFKTGRLYAVRVRYKSKMDRYQDPSDWKESEWMWMGSQYPCENEIEFFESVENAIQRASDLNITDDDKYTMRVVTMTLEYTDVES